MESAPSGLIVTMKLLFIGDIVGKPGRSSVAQWLPQVREEFEIDIVLANAENAAGGLGATPEILGALKDLGIDGFTLGNHTWRKQAIIAALDGMPEIVRPANYPAGVPGRGHCVLRLKDGRKVGLVNLLGRVFMEPFACPFACADEVLETLQQETPLIVVDMHAEATSEKMALGWHLDGRCTAVLGTHTHVQTADERILPDGTAYLTDVGMCGPIDSVIGSRREPVIEKFRTGLPRKFEVAKGAAQFCGVVVKADDTTGRAQSITRVQRRDLN